MIAKVVPGKKGSGFRDLGAYLMDVKSGAHPAGWSHTGLIQRGYEQNGAKVAWIRATNSATTDPGWTLTAMMAHADMNTRAKGSKYLHLVVSFPPGESPDRDQLEIIEHRFVVALGMEHHMRVSVGHRDQGHAHFHVILSRIDPVTYHIKHPFRDRFRLQATCLELEQELGLTKGRHPRDAREVALGKEHPDRPIPTLDPSVESFKRARAAALLARDRAVREMQVRHVDYARRLAEWHTERSRQEEVLALRGHLRRDGFTHLAEQRRKDRAERMVRERQEREAVLAAHPVPTWEDFCRAGGTQPPGTAAAAGRDTPAERASARPAPYKRAYKNPEEHQR